MRIPQGSILKPVLILVFINDLVLNNGLVKYTLVADDTTLVLGHNEMTDNVNCFNTNRLLLIKHRKGYFH